MQVTSFGAANEVTGSCHLLQAVGKKILIDAGLFQGGSDEYSRNMQLGFEPAEIDAIVLSHAHIDHSGRIPLLVKLGFRGSVYTHPASTALCRILLKDSAYLGEKDVQWENRKRQRKHLPPLQPLYTIADAQKSMAQFKSLQYLQPLEIFPGISVTLRDAGHILGSAIVEIWVHTRSENKRIVFSGDLGHRGAPILRDPSYFTTADVVFMESTYGDRNHRNWDSTFAELQTIMLQTNHLKGNILIPAFAVGRSQELIYLFEKYFEEWQMQRWQIFLDSPMAIEANKVYAQFAHLFDQNAGELWQERAHAKLSKHFHLSHTPLQSMKINQIQNGAIIIAGSGMCTGGRIRHHLKHRIWRKGNEVLFVGYQSQHSLGCQLVDGAQEISLWGDRIHVGAKIHTIGGLSAHADQAA